MQPACAQVSAKSILTGALKPKRVNSSHQYAWPRSYQGKMLTLGWMMESRVSITRHHSISSSHKAFLTTSASCSEQSQLTFTSQADRVPNQPARKGSNSRPDRRQRPSSSRPRFISPSWRSGFYNLQDKDIEKGLGDTITKDNNENELTFGDALQHRNYHHKTVLLPKARNDWKNLRFLDYKVMDEYNSVLFKTVSILRLCGEVVTKKELLEKSYSTFHVLNVILQQYRTKGFATYTDLIACLLLAETKFRYD
ncbi:hypothetical protein YC2023_108357 [Brassica napus]